MSAASGNPDMPAAPGDPAEDWARAIAEMTGNGTEVTGSRSGVTATCIDADEDADAAATDADAAATDAHGAATDAAAAPAQSGSAAGGRPRLALAAMLGAAIVVIGGFGIWAAVAAHDLRASATDANLAFTDPAATRAVDGQVAAAVNTIFSYSYADSARTRAAAQDLLTGAAIRQYNQLFSIVEQQAPKAKLTVTTRVTDIGAELLTGARARVLVFANQQDTAAGTGKTSYGGAMFAVTAVNQHGKWRIESIDTFTGPA